MKKTNKLVIGLALAATLFGYGKSQETKAQELEQKAPAVLTVEENISTNQVVATEGKTNDVIQAATSTNVVEEAMASKNVFRGTVSLTNATEQVEKTVEPVTAPVSTNVVEATTNVVDTTTATTNAVETTTNVVNTATETTNTVETITNVVNTATTKNAVETATNNVNQATVPPLTAEQQILIQEVMPQISQFAMKDGMTTEQLFALGAFMHLEKDVGTRDLAHLYHQAAKAGMDLTMFEIAYANRLRDQQDFMRACQMGIADARINNKDTFVMSGVSFNIHSKDLVENLLTFKDARDNGDYSVVIEGRPFKIFRTPEDVDRIMNSKKREVLPTQIVTPYGVYIRQDINVR